MSYLALYRKYRPTTFDELVGQHQINTVIGNAIKNDKISHAYLFCGPRGTGKTTTAKLIAKIVNCEDLDGITPCGKCKSCISMARNNNDDIIEIDAASNNGVDEIREIRDNVNLVPAMCKYKIYIIDEVHMLTTGAFNALLKTLEEPPAHVIFILATTEPQKVPMTIFSRCQKFTFNKVNDENAVLRLKEIGKNENINITDAALNQIVKISDGGMRDAINMLDQLSLYTDDLIDVDDVFELNGMVPYIELFDLLKYVISDDKKEIIRFVEKKDAEGKKFENFLHEFMVLVKEYIIYKCTGDRNSLDDYTDEMLSIIADVDIEKLYYFVYELNKLLNEIKTSDYPKIITEVALLKLADEYSLGNKNGKYFPGNNIVNKTTENKENLEEKNKDDLGNNVEKSLGNNLEEKNESEVHPETNISNINEKNGEEIEMDEHMIKLEAVRINNAFTTADKKKLNEIKEKWSEICEYLLDKKYATIAGILNDTAVVVAGNNNLVLTVKLSSIKNRIYDNMKEIDKFIKFLLGDEYKIVVLTEDVWEIKRNEYIKNIKEKKIYSYMEEPVINLKSIKKTKDKNVPKELADVLGDDIIEVK